MARLILVTGDKGGVGKSFFARTLVDWMGEQPDFAFKAFDTDRTNSTLFRFHPEVSEQLDVSEPSNMDALLELLRTQDAVVVVDCAARALDTMIHWMEEIDFLGLKQEMGFQMTLAFLLGPEKDCVQILKDVSQFFTDQVDYILVKNLSRGRSFSLYDGSQTRSTILEKLGGIELELPVLLEKTALELDRKNLAFSIAAKDMALPIADQQRVKIFRRRMSERLQEVARSWK